MLKDPLRFWAVMSQAVGFTLIVLLETWLGRAQAGYWQIRVLLLMLAAALLIAILRRYQQQRALQLAAKRRQLLRDEEADD
jgi:cytochrome c-type biogenesis protein CcmH/NrfF